MARMVVSPDEARIELHNLTNDFMEKLETKGAPPDSDDLKKAVVTEVPKPDSYMERLLKYIPTEVVGVYLTLYGIIKTSADQLPLQAWLWILFVIGLIGTPLYLWLVASVTKKMQLAISTIAFLVWVFATGGGPFAEYKWFLDVYGSMALVLFTFLAPMYKG